MRIGERTIETARGGAAWLDAGGGWPLILLHAFPFTADMWRPQLERVPDGWRFIAPEFRGFGRSPMPPGALSVDDYAADIGALMDALEIEDAVIGGLSMGGYVAFAMFREAPARFTRMILADTRSAADTPRARAARGEMRALLAERGAAGVAERMLPNLFSPDADAALIERTRAQIASIRPAALDAAIGALMDRPDSTPLLARITCATLVLAGGRDALIPLAEAEAMQRAIPRSSLAVIQGAGHIANLEQPDTFSRALADFLLSAL